MKFFPVLRVLGSTVFQTKLRVMFPLALTLAAQTPTKEAHVTEPKDCKQYCEWTVAWWQGMGPDNLNMHVKAQDGTDMGSLQVEGTGTPTVLFANHLKGHTCRAGAQFKAFTRNGESVNNGLDSAGGEVAESKEGQFQGHYSVPAGGRFILYDANVVCNITGQPLYQSKRGLVTCRFSTVPYLVALGGAVNTCGY